MLRLITFVCLSVLFASCNHSSTSTQSELKVCYKVTVLRSDLASFATLALPDEIYYYHSDNRTMVDIQAIIGNIRIRQIGNLKNGTNAIVLDYFNKRITCQTKEPSYFFLPFFNRVKISNLDGDTVIENYNCKYKQVVFEENTLSNYTLLYTPQSQFKTLNQYTPYKEIPGLLMRFEMHSPKLDLQLQGCKVTHEALPDSLFEVPGGYDKVSPATMRSVLLSLFGSDL